MLKELLKLLYVLLTVHLDIIVQRNTKLMQNLFLAYFVLVCFVNLYMFRAYLGPSSGGTTVCVQQLVLIILFRRLSVVLVGLFQSNPDNLVGLEQSNLYMFRAYLGPSSGGTTVCIQQMVLIILFRRLSVVLVGLFQSNQDSVRLGDGPKFPPSPDDLTLFILAIFYKHKVSKERDYSVMVGLTAHGL